LEQRIQASRNLVIEAQQSLDSRAAELARSIQAAFGELENRTTAAHDSETAAHEMALAAKRSLEDQIQASRDFIIESRQNLNLQRVELAQTAEAAFRELENRTNIARDSETAAQQRTQALEKEIAEATFRLQKAVEQVNHTAQSTVGKFDNHITAQLKSWSAQFKSHLDAVSRDKSTQFAAEIEQQLTSHRQQMNETLEKLSAGLHLAQGTARMQEERLAELSRDTAASFEAEIRRVLLRLAGPV
jgi:thiamine biosynthesis lipoprotein ApbE